jgi:hypothetical protein
MTPGAPNDESDLSDFLQPYPPADITPREFEEWVTEVLASGGERLDQMRVEIHERVTGIDGSYDFDATARYRWAGLDFLIVVEAKRHANPIKRELVQVLQSKVQSVGAHKGVMISTARFQRGAIEFAKRHGIALVSVTEGRFTFETRGAAPQPALSREAAREFGLPPFVGFCYGPGDTPASTTSTLISTEYPDYIRELLLGAPAHGAPE